LSERLLEGEGRRGKFEFSVEVEVLIAVSIESLGFRLYNRRFPVASPLVAGGPRLYGSDIVAIGAECIRSPPVDLIETAFSSTVDYRFLASM
jgi:hypothetical protein